MHSGRNGLHSHQPTFPISECLYWIWGPPRSSIQDNLYFKTLNSITLRNSFQWSICNSRGLGLGILGLFSERLYVFIPSCFFKQRSFLLPYQSHIHPPRPHLISFLLLSQNTLTKSNTREGRVCLRSLFQAMVHDCSEVTARF